MEVCDSSPRGLVDNASQQPTRVTSGGDATSEEDAVDKALHAGSRGRSSTLGLIGGCFELSLRLVFQSLQAATKLVFVVIHVISRIVL